MPHHDLVSPTCQHRHSKHPRQKISSRMATASLNDFTSRWMASASPEDRQALRYAMGTLQFRKQRNRKRTSTGEYVWSDEADVAFALALIAWTSNRSYRVGTRRSVFLQQFLGRYGFTKNRKQIASRLQVLKGEWSSSPYLDLLKDPDDSGEPRSRTGSSSPSLLDEQSPTSSTAPALTTDTLLRTSPGPFQHIEQTTTTVATPANYSQERSSFGAAPLYPPAYSDPQNQGHFGQAYPYNFSHWPREYSSPSAVEPHLDTSGRQSHSSTNFLHDAVTQVTYPFSSPGPADTVDSLFASPNASFHATFTPPDCEVIGQIPASQGPSDGHFYDHDPFSF